MGQVQPQHPVDLGACTRWAALAGALAALALWLADLLTLRQLLVAGVGDSAAQQVLMREGGPAVRALEMKLAALHLLVGAALGGVAGLAATAVPRLRRSRRGRPLVAAAVVLAAFALLLAGMVTRYPQVYADRWWLGGGARATGQRLLTHHTSPLVWDMLLVLLLGAVAAGAAFSLRRPLHAWVPRRLPRLAAVLLLGAAMAGAFSAHPPAPSQPATPDVLLLVGDSLRRDRLESAAVMPFTAQLRARGTYFPHAYTAVARTLPSWASLLTGLEPRQHGVTTMFPRDEVLDALGPTLFGELRDRGYFTFVVSDFAGDFFPRMGTGFDVVDTPHLTVDTLAASTVLSAHTWSLPLLRAGAVRWLVPEWANLPDLSDPRWMAERAREHMAAARGRPYAGVVFFSNGHFPYPAPYPHYLRDSAGYKGRFLYHVPPVAGDDNPSPQDVAQVRARYDGAFAAIDGAIGGLVGDLERRGRLGRTVVLITGDHGEELYEEAGIAGHGDALGSRSQSVPVLLMGPQVPAGVADDAQVRLLDIPATVLDLLPGAARPARFGAGVSLLAAGEPRPLCVETGIWFWPDRPRGLNGRRLVYPGITELVELDARTRHLVLKREHQMRVETAKDRGLVLGNRLWHQRPTPDAIERWEEPQPGVTPAGEGQDLRALFDQRCVQGNPRLGWLYGAVVAAAAGSSP